MPADDQRVCSHGGLWLTPRTLYRATSARLSPLPPFAPLAAPIAYLPSPLALERGLFAPSCANDATALERGLFAPACANDGYIYLTAAINAHCYIPPRSHLLTSIHALTDAEARMKPLPPIVNALYREDGMWTFRIPDENGVPPL
jgi:hypothetical protein